MRVLHVFNRHRGGGGADNAWDATIRISAESGLDIGIFSRDSRDLPPGLRGKLRAFIGGIYPRDAVRDFSRTLAEFKPDVVHAHELFPLISPWILPRCAAAGVPTILTCYDFRLTCPIATHYRASALCHRCVGGRELRCLLHNCRGSIPESASYALRSAIARSRGLFERYVSRFIVLSEFSARWLTERAGIAPERIDLVPCAVPLPPVPVSDPSEGAYVGYAGRFVPEKGVECLVEAARRAGIPLRMAGDAPKHPAVRPEDGTQFVMTRSPSELAAFYRASRIIVVPSLWYETFGLVPAEAMSHGIPVIVSRIGALQQIAQDELSGLQFEPGNIAELAEKLARIWNDAALCRRLGSAARERIASRCSEAAHFRNLTMVYEKARAAPLRMA